jgi:hypothetical protein
LEDRRELQKAIVEEGVTQASIASELDVNRSVIHRQIVGYENLGVGRVGEIASVLGRVPFFRLLKPAECSNYFVPVMAAVSSRMISATPVAHPRPNRLSIDARGCSIFV